jgi:hypothetical protein
MLQFQQLDLIKDAFGNQAIFAGNCLFPAKIDQMFSEDICVEMYRLKQLLRPVVDIRGFSIQEKFSDEENPHFMTEFFFGKKGGFSITIDVSYTAIETTEEKEHAGCVTFILYADSNAYEMKVWKSVIVQLYYLYARAIEIEYPTWQTEYDLNTLFV